MERADVMVENREVARILRETSNLLEIDGADIGRYRSYEKVSQTIENLSERIEEFLDSGVGSCWLRDARVAAMMAQALSHFDGVRYRLHAWCVMPNHVHVVIEPLAGHALADILYAWKSYSAKAANRLLGRSGEFWQPEYYDHLIRDEQEYGHAIRYVLDNPKKAGLGDWQWVGADSMGS